MQLRVISQAEPPVNATRIRGKLDNCNTSHRGRIRIRTFGPAKPPVTSVMPNSRGSASVSIHRSAYASSSIPSMKARESGKSLAMPPGSASPRPGGASKPRLPRTETAPSSSDETLFEAVAQEVFRRCGRTWKPRTRYVSQNYYRRQLLSWFKGCQIAEITRGDVQEWFVSLHVTPVAADRLQNPGAFDGASCDT